MREKITLEFDDDRDAVEQAKIGPRLIEACKTFNNHLDHMANQTSYYAELRTLYRGIVMHIVNEVAIL